MWVDGLLFLGLATAASILLATVIYGIYAYGSVYSSTREIASVCMLVILM